MPRKHFLIARPHCPRCLALIDGCTALTDEGGPDVGDLSVCVSCGTALEFTDALGHVRTLSGEDIAALPEPTRHMLAHAQASVATFKASRK